MIGGRLRGDILAIYPLKKVSITGGLFSFIQRRRRKVIFQKRRKGLLVPEEEEVLLLAGDEELLPLLEEEASRLPPEDKEGLLLSEEELTLLVLSRPPMGALEPPIGHSCLKVRSGPMEPLPDPNLPARICCRQP